MSDRSTAVVLLNWNGWQDTIACMESLLQLRDQTPWIVVCDNASTDGSWQHLLDWCTRNQPDAHTVYDVQAPSTAEPQLITLIQTGANLGFAGGCNVGIRFALQHTACEYVWLLNNDTVVDADSLQQQVMMLRQDATIGLLGSTLVYYDRPERVQCFGGYGFNFWTGRVRPLQVAPDRSSPPSVPFVEQHVRYVSGASTMVTRPFLESVGLLNEQYFLYFEEVDWAVRRRGFRLSYCPSSIVLHKEGRSIGSSASAHSRSLQSEGWLSRNRVLFTRTYFPLRVPVVLLWMACVVVVRALRGHWQLARAMAGGALRGCTAPIVPPPSIPSKANGPQHASQMENHYSDKGNASCEA